MHAAGPTRLVLINSGKFDYGEVELGSPLHLIGPNNVGKTTLISTLQFLYIDHQNQMHFSRDLEETRRYYFPGQDSYLLFECLTPKGYMVAGARGLGPLKGWNFMRFCYRGMYSRDVFIDDEGRVRPFDDIMRDLGVLDYTELRPRDLMSALTGIGTSSDVNLGLVPVKDRNGYAKFRTIFRNLLRLAHLSQQELKSFLLEVNRSELRLTEIDLAGDFSSKYRLVQKSVRELADLRANTEIAVELLKLAEERKELRLELPEIRAFILGAGEKRRKKLEGRRGEASEELERLRERERELDSEKHELMKESGEIQRRIGVLEDRLQRYHDSEKRFSGYLHEFEKSEIARLEERVTATAMKLKDASREDAEQVGNRLEGSKRELQKLRGILKNISSSAAASWGELPADSDEIFRILNREILAMPAGEEGLEVLSREGVADMLDNLSERISSGIYSDDSVRMNLASLEPPDLEFLTDSRRLELSIAGLESNIQRDGQAMEALEKMEDLKREHHRLAEEVAEKRRLYSEWERFEEDGLHAEEWEADLNSLQEREGAVSRELEGISEEMFHLAEKETGLTGIQKSCSDDLDDLQKKLAGLPPLPSAWAEEVEEKESELSLEELLRIFDRKFSREASLSDRIADGLRGIEARTYGRYPASKEESTLSVLREDIEALDRKEEAVRKLWAGLATDLGQAFKGLVQSLEILESKVIELNRKLSGISISDLRKLSLRVSRDSRLMELVRTRIDAEEMPLFTDRKAVERSLESLGEMLERTAGGRIQLLDMFNLSFEITTGDGRTRKFTRLENIESHGTTITIKVLVNLMLLRGLMEGREVSIPFYLDEASSLDRDNLYSVVETAFSLGFPAVLASPDAMDVARNLYFMKETEGRVYLDPEKSRIRLSREYSSAAEEPNSNETG